MLAAPDCSTPRAQTGAEAPVATGTRPVRIADQHLQNALNAGYDRSPTLRRQLQRLAELGVIVYVEWRPGLPARTEAVTEEQKLVTAHATYVRVALRPATVSDHLVAVIAHELQHVLEIVETEPRKRTSRGQTHRQSSGGTEMQVFETDAAIDAGRLVARELREHRVRHAPLSTCSDPPSP